MRIAGSLLAAVGAIWAQEFKLPPAIEQLSAKAVESVDVTLDKSMLSFAGRFLSGKDEDEARAKRLLAGLDSVTVRSFEFANPGEYDPKALDSLRGQFQAPVWSRVVGVRSRGSGDNIDVYFKNAAGGQVNGVLIISAEPRELTIVNLAGAINPEKLADAGGRFHIPRLDWSRRVLR